MIEPEKKESEEYSMGMGKMNVLVLLLFIPVLLLTILPYLLIWDYETFKVGWSKLMDYFIIWFLGGIILHEQIHGLTWVLFTKNGAFLSFGIIFTLAAGGDIIMLFMMRKLNKDMWVKDHPDKVGFLVETENL